MNRRVWVSVVAAAVGVVTCVASRHVPVGAEEVQPIQTAQSQVQTQPPTQVHDVGTLYRNAMPGYDMPWNGDPIRKLGRGLANTFGGVLEIPMGIERVSATEGPMAGISVGFLYGLGAAVTRAAVGVGEVLTFVFPLPEIGYGPILRPEFLLNPNAPQMFPTLPSLFPESGGK